MTLKKNNFTMVAQLAQDLFIKMNCIIEYRSSILRVDLIDRKDF